MFRSLLRIHPLNLRCCGQRKKHGSRAPKYYQTHYKFLYFDFHRSIQRLQNQVTSIVLVSTTMLRKLYSVKEGTIFSCARTKLRLKQILPIFVCSQSRLPCLTSPISQQLKHIIQETKSVKLTQNICYNNLYSRETRTSYFENLI